MALYEITVHKNPATYATVWKDKNTAKAAYDYGVDQGTEIFGEVPYSVVIKEEKPVV
jgi:hypothetical protein